MRSFVSVWTIETGMPCTRPGVTNRLLVVPKAVVFVGKRGSFEHALCIHKVEPVVLQVRLRLTSSHVNRIEPVYIQDVYTSRRSV